MKTAIIGGWALGLGAIGLSADPRWPGGWMLLVGLGMLPPVLFLRMWHQLGETRLDGLRELIGERARPHLPARMSSSPSST